MENFLKKIEINCDMGEGFGKWKMGPDEELMKYIDVANIACGFHAGDPSLMVKTVRLAKQHGVKAGAHPGLQDLFGFGRRQMVINPADMFAMILYQVGSLKAMLDYENVPLNHIKPHGELFHYMQRDLTICRAVLEACVLFKVPVYGAKGADDEKKICEELGIVYIEEAYVDVLYTKDRKLVPIAPDKMVKTEDIYKKTLSIGRTDATVNENGESLKLGFDGAAFSICVHSDMPTALENVKGETLGSKFVMELHPLDPLSPQEISIAAEIPKDAFPQNQTLFWAITLAEPPKALLVPYLQAEKASVPREAPPRISFIQYYLDHASNSIKRKSTSRRMKYLLERVNYRYCKVHLTLPFFSSLAALSEASFSLGETRDTVYEILRNPPLSLYLGKFFRWYEKSINFSTGNNSVLEYDTCGDTYTEIIFPGITDNPTYLVTGIDYSPITKDIYISADARAAFYTNGLNLTGPNMLIRYSPSTQSIIYSSDMSAILLEIYNETGKLVGGFQDQAEDLEGNAYYMVTWGNLLVKVTPGGEASKYYLPPLSELNTTAPGFGGLFALGNMLVVSDAISASFVIFDLTSPTGLPKFVKPSKVPSGYSPLLCDSLYAPEKYAGTVALCADDWVDGIGAVVVYRSSDEWKSAEYVGMVFNDRVKFPGSTATATFEVGEGIFTSQAYLPDAAGVVPIVLSFPFVDISTQIDALILQ
ncbi:hypothetical protein G7Y89_g1425 [Cudoniella acicularis]|uniref:Copper amine oxidase N2-terminal domain-containing protein n=1 Tax=Cudoniella acicularis TaxID=354080 RepID=A0A8H4RVA9_9HELO|nr:hypothetical protein G7Y89_g1425 [Cudoniella acicularis]